MTLRRLALLALPALLIGVGGAWTSTAEEPRYQFSADWVNKGGRVEDWTMALKRFRGKRGVHGLEIGSFEGRSAVWLLANVLTANSSTLTCVDPFPESYGKVFDANIAATGSSNRVVKKVGLSSQVLRGLKQNAYDFIYIDGCHEAACVYLDAALSWDLLKIGGVLIFDDYIWSMDEAVAHRPKVAIDAFVEAFLPFVEVLQTNNHSLILEKTGDAFSVLDETDVYGTISKQGEKRRARQREAQARKQRRKAAP